MPRESVGSPTLEIPKSWLDETLNKHGLSRPSSGPNDLQRSLPAWFCDSESDPTAGNGRTLAIMLGDGAVWVSHSWLGWNHWWIQGFSWLYVKFYGEPNSYKLFDSAREDIICWLVSLINAGIYLVQHWQLIPLNFSWCFGPGQEISSLEKAFSMHVLTQNFKASSSPAETWSAGKNLQSNGSWINQSKCFGLHPALEGCSGDKAVCWVFVTMVMV